MNDNKEGIKQILGSLTAEELADIKIENEDIILEADEIISECDEIINM